VKARDELAGDVMSSIELQVVQFPGNKFGARLINRTRWGSTTMREWQGRDNVLSPSQLADVLTEVSKVIADSIVTTSERESDMPRWLREDRRSARPVD
jgi:hypothetical protein